MKSLISLVTIIFYSCFLFSQDAVLFRSIKDTSSFEIILDGKDTLFRTTDVSFDIDIDGSSFNDVLYLIKKKKITESYQLMPYPEKTIEVVIYDLNNLNEKLYNFSRKSDEIDVSIENKKYKTKSYGCCAEQDYVDIYDFNDSLIIGGDYKVFESKINDHLIFYVSFQSVYDSCCIGKINFVVNDSFKYVISLEGQFNNKHGKFGEEEICPMVDPIFDFGKTFRIEKDYILTNFSRKIISEAKELNFKIKVKFDCDPSINEIEIPIIKGRPFGNNILTQKIKIR